MISISALGGLSPVEPLDLAVYADSADFKPLPNKGRYTVKAPESFSETSFTASKSSGALVAQVDPTIIGPSNEGYVLRYTKPSAKVFKRNGVNVSQLGDYLRACGHRGKLTNPQEQADAVEQTANTIYQVDVDWKAYNKATGFSVEGMERFPSDGNGGHLPWIEDPNDYEKDESTGEFITDAQGDKIHVRVRANVFVNRFVPAT
jgi:hypothetical protein